MADLRNNPIVLSPIGILRDCALQPERYDLRFLRGQSEPRLHGGGAAIVDRVLFQTFMGPE